MVFLRAPIFWILPYHSCLNLFHRRPRERIASRISLIGSELNLQITGMDVLFSALKALSPLNCTNQDLILQTP